MANPTQTPTLENGALTPATPAVAASAEEQALLAASFRFGLVLEELVWRLIDMARQAHTAADASSPLSSLDFPPDLTHDSQKVLGAPQSVSAGTIGTRVDILLETYEQKQNVVPLLTGPDRIGALVHLWDADRVDAIVNQPPEILTAYELGKALSQRLQNVLEGLYQGHKPLLRGAC